MLRSIGRKADTIPHDSGILTVGEASELIDALRPVYLDRRRSKRRTRRPRKVFYT